MSGGCYMIYRKVEDYSYERPSRFGGWGCKIHPSKYPGSDTKQSNGEAPVMLEFWRMWITPSLPSLPYPLWPGVVAPDRILSMGQIELFDI